MKNWNIIALSLILAFGMAYQAQAQYETENVAKYRKVYGFDAPNVNMASDTNNENVAEVLMIPRDSFGVYYIYDPQLDRLVEMQKQFNFDKVDGPGFRIQIYAGSKLEHANESKSDFIEAFGSSDMEVYQKWQPPHFRVRVGDFLSKGQAMREMAMIRQVFSDAFIVSDKIHLPKYKNKVIVNDLETVGNNGNPSPN